MTGSSGATAPSASYPRSSSSSGKDCLVLSVGFVLALAVTAWWTGSNVAGARGAVALPRVMAGSRTGAGGPAVGGGAASARRASTAVAAPARGGAGAAGAARVVHRTLMRDICNNTERYPEELPEYDIMGAPGSSTDDWATPTCYWTDMWHPAVPMKPLNVCSHNPVVDTVISHFLHTYHFWGSPDDYLLLLATGPCSAERPYMLDIGSNLGVFSIMGASRGCYIAAFEPLSQNILRVKASLENSGWGDRAVLYKHAVGKLHATVRIGFRPSNPGASALGHGAEEEEIIEQITIDALLHGKNPPKFKGPGAAKLPPFIGRYINFAKIDTEGYDVAVFDGALKTFMEGRVPHILIEFSPGDAQGTAGCDSWNFMRLIYANHYRMYEQSRAYPLKELLETGLDNALHGRGRRVFEAWIISDEAAVNLMQMGLLQPFGVN